MRCHRSLSAAVLSLALLLSAAARTCPAQVDEPPGPGEIIDITEVRRNIRATTLPATAPATRPATQATQATQASQPKADTPEDCRRLHMKGQYSAAADGYRKLMSKPSLRVSAAVGLAEALAMEGWYDQALEALSSVRADAAGRADWHLAMADLLGAVGRYEDALSAATASDHLRPAWAPAIFARGRLLETLGREDEAVAVYRSMEKVVEGDAYRKDAQSLVALGNILDRYGVLTGKKASEQAANILHNYLQEAYQVVDKEYWPANLAAGMFLLSKHRPDQAMQEFALVKKLNPRVPDIYVGAAVVLLSQWNFEGCLAQVEEALKINPRHADAHVMKAACNFQWRKLDEVEPHLQKALKTNPNHLEALSLMAALHVRQEQPDKAQEYVDRVHKVNPRSADLQNAIGQWLSAGRQFAQAERHFQKAAELAPKMAEPLTNLGLLYMQTGDEDKAKETLRKAHALDDFRADVVNYLRLLEKLEKFQVRETPHFIIKADGEFDAILLDQVAAFMDRIGSEVCRDFDHTPPVKTIVEFFPSHTQFSVRITGRGWIGTVGASTGRVIAMVAPSPDTDRTGFGPYNWATVLRHEYTHTVTLSATSNRIPHWFTEACAVWQQPDRRSFEAVRMLVDATRGGRLFPIREADWGFIRPKRAGDRSLAYAQSEWMMEFIIEKNGFATIAKMLKGFRDGMAQGQVFEKIVGIGEKDFDKAFRDWAKEQVRQWGYDPEPIPDPAQAAKLAQANPNDPAAQAAHAVALYYRRQLKPAQEAARKALELDPKNAKALAVLGMSLLAEKKYDEAIDAANRLEEADHTSRSAPRILAEAHVAKREWAQAIAALELLKHRQHLDPYSYEQLARMYMQFGQPAKALPNLIELHRRTMKDTQYARQIAEIYRTLGQGEQALDYYDQITYINPYEVSTYEAMASIHLGAKRYDRAIAAVQNVCLLKPDSATSWSLMAMVQYRAGKAGKDRQRLQEAKAAAEKALKLDPNSQAKELLEMIDQAMKA